MPNPLNPYKSSVLVFFICLMFSFSRAQEYPNSLLWSITGNGLKKPSFLFGTIHLQDKRVFGFTDSVYHSIQSADGFAMEVHPDSMVLSMFMNVQHLDSKPLKKAMNKKEYQKLRNKLIREWKVDPEKLSVNDAYQLKRKLSMPDLRKDDMPAIVDLYLYSIARDQGKSISGLEKITDQLNLLKEVDKNFNPKDLVSDVAIEKNFIENMISVYVEEDLNKIMKMQSMLGEEYEDKVLNSRNKVMVENMDSLMRSLSYFVAIGAAHLPGPKGVIQLLREKGYKVEPVISANHLPAGTYQYKNHTKWEVFSDPLQGYKIAMPGRVTPMPLHDGLMTMNNHLDFANMKFYYISSFSIAQNLKSKNPDSLFAGFLASFAGKQHVIIEKSRMKYKDSIEMLEFIAKDNNSSYIMKLRLALVDNRLYMIGVGSQRMDALKDEATAYYFNSFEPANQEFVRTNHTVTALGFSVMFPVPPSKKEEVLQEDPSVQTFQYNAPDAATGIYYVVVVSSVKPTYILSGDTVYFNAVMEGFASRTGMKIISSADTTVAGCKARYFLSQDNKNAVVSKVLMIKRGGQVFNLIATVESENIEHPDVKKFFSSVNQAPYLNNSWQKQSMADSLFMTWAPAKFEKKQNAFESAESSKQSYYSFDSVLSVTYEVNIENLNEFIWSRNDTSLLHHWIQDYILDDEKIISHRYFKQGKSRGAEMVISSEDESVFKKVKVMLNGNKKYTAFAFIPVDFKDEPNQLKFFSEWQINDDTDQEKVLNNTPELLLTSLSSNDSLKRENAFNALYSAPFDKDDFPMLLERAVESVPQDDLNEELKVNLLFNKLSAIADNSCIGQLKTTYMQLPKSQPEFDYRILKVLADIKTEESFSAIQELLERRLPSKGEAFNFIYSVADSLALAKKIYANLYKYSNDSSLALPLFYLHDKMLEKGFISAEDLQKNFKVLDGGLKIIHDNISSSSDSDRFWYIDPVTSILGKLSTKEADEWLARLIKLTPTNIKLEAAMQLLLRNREVPRAELQKIAEDPEQRIYLYDRLESIKKQKLYPAIYHNQKDFGEGYLYNSEEDDRPSRIIFTSEMEETFAGKKCTFLLYKVIFEVEGEALTYLGVAGPFKKGKVVVAPEENISGAYYSQDYIPGLERKFLRSYLQQFSEEE